MHHNFYRRTYKKIISDQLPKKIPEGPSKLWSILYSRLSSSKRKVIVSSLFRNLVRSNAEEALNLAGLPYSSMLYTRLHGVIINSVLLDARLICVTARPHAVNCVGILHFDIRMQKKILRVYEGGLRNFFTIIFTFKTSLFIQSLAKFPSRGELWE